jgi:Glutaredoxin-like domain (DUF836)
MEQRTESQINVALYHVMAVRVVVISKPGCHLCEEVIGAIESLPPGLGLELEVLDILQDGRLHDQYFLRIPVVRVDGLDVFEAHDMVRGGDLSRRLEALLAKRKLSA